MQMISTAAAAVPALAFTPSKVAASTKGSDRTVWGAEYARFKAIDVEYDRRICAEEQASEAVEAECPREDRFFSEYHLSMGEKRESVVWHARHAIAAREGWNGLVVFPKAQSTISEQLANAIREQAEQIADEFMAYQAKHDDAQKRHGVKELWAKVEEYRPIWFAARDRFMAVPAPDVEALMIKFEIAGNWVDDDYVASSFDDARRLLSSAH